MAGLLDMFGPQSGGGLLGNFGGYLNNNQDALMALGLGLAGGSTPTEGFRYGMQGLLQGRKSDRERVAGDQFIKELMGATGAPMSPAGAPAGMPAPAMMPPIAPMPPMGGPQFMPPGPVAPPVNAPRPPVMPTAKVWGDAEAERAGLYEPTKVAAFSDRFPAAPPPAPPAAPPVQMAQAPQAMPQAAPQPVPNDQLGAIRNMPIGTVLKWAMNPNLAGAQREVAKEIFKARLEDTKMTDGQKDYMRAKVDGFAGSFADWKNNPSFGDTGQRDEFDRPVQGWRNPNTGTVSPPRSNVPGAAPDTKPPIELVSKLRGEVQKLPSYVNITEAAPVYRSMLDAANRDDRAADVNMIYGLAKIMDPKSVVRESEMTMAQAVATLPQHLQASIMSQIQSTGRLSPEVRDGIMREAHSRATAYKNEFDRDSKQYRGIVGRYRMNPEDVLPDFGEFPKHERKAAAPPPASGAEPTATNPKTGEKMRLQGGKWVPLQTGPRT